MFLSFLLYSPEAIRQQWDSAEISMTAGLHEAHPHTVTEPGAAATRWVRFINQHTPHAYLPINTIYNDLRVSGCPVRLLPTRRLRSITWDDPVFLAIHAAARYGY